MNPDKWLEEMTRRKDEPLDEELQDYVEDNELLGKSLKHPLVYQLPLHMAWQANDQLAQKKKALAQAVNEGDYYSYVYLYERPYRAIALENIVGGLEDDEYWQMCASVWTDTENHWQERLRWNRLLRSDRPEQEHFMTGEEQEAFAALPDELTVHRGWNGLGRAVSLSWTLDYAKAEWFAQRLLNVRKGEPATVTSGLVAKADVLGLLEGRGEQEIVIPRPAKVRITETKEVNAE